MSSETWYKLFCDVRCSLRLPVTVPVSAGVNRSGKAVPSPPSLVALAWLAPKLATPSSAMSNGCGHPRRKNKPAPSPGLLFLLSPFVTRTIFYQLVFATIYESYDITMQLSGLLLLPLLVAADQQPLMDKVSGWYDAAKAYVSNPVDEGAAKFTDLNVKKMNRNNWEQILTPKVEGQEDWLIYVTGGNKSCFGKCGRSDEAWNVCMIMACSSLI